MWLLGASTLELYEFLTDVPDYVILSHTWGPEEVSFDDIKDPQARQEQKGFDKILGCCQQALQDGFEWVWIDTCCIDKRSSAELSEAINSMYEWYWRAAKCYAYLSDAPEQRPFVKSLWFGRGWTLQELLAPVAVEFYDHGWNFMGTKLGLADDIEAATGIQKTYIVDRRTVQDASIATKFSWASGRITTRIEDTAYCLLGLMGVNMPMLYGEGPSAFMRLQLELLKSSNDHTIFAWGHRRPCDPRTGNLIAVEASTDDFPTVTAVLAPSPVYFRNSVGLRSITASRPVRALTHEVTNNGLRICLPCDRRNQKSSATQHIAWLYCMDTEGRTIGIKLGRSLKAASYFRVNMQLYTRSTEFTELHNLADMYLQIKDRNWSIQRWQQFGGGAVSLRVNRVHTYLGCNVRFVSLSSEHDVSTVQNLVAWSATFTVDANYILNELIVPEDKVAALCLSSPAGQEVDHLIVLGIYQSQPVIFTSEIMYKDSLNKNWYQILAGTPNKWTDHVRDYHHVGSGDFRHIIQAKVMKEGTRLTWSATISASREADRRDFYCSFSLFSKDTHQENNLACYCVNCRYKRVLASQAPTGSFLYDSRTRQIASMQWELQKQRQDKAADHVVECTCSICSKESRLELDPKFEAPFPVVRIEECMAESTRSPTTSTIVSSLPNSLHKEKGDKSEESSRAL